MNLKGYTQIGLLTGLVILLFQLLMIRQGLQSSPLIGLQFMLLLIGIFIAIYLYNNANKLVILDLFMIGVRTMSSALVVLVLGAVLFYYIFPRPSDSHFTYNLMMVIFPFGMSGALSSFVSAIIVNKLLQKT
jgi:hypothetical protein